MTEETQNTKIFIKKKQQKTIKSQTMAITKPSFLFVRHPEVNESTL